MFRKLLRVMVIFSILAIVALLITTSDGWRNWRSVSTIESAPTQAPTQSVVVVLVERRDNPKLIKLLKQFVDDHAKSDEIARRQAEMFQRLGFSTNQFSSISVTAGTNGTNNGAESASGGGKK